MQWSTQSSSKLANTQSIDARAASTAYACSSLSKSVQLRSRRSSTRDAISTPLSRSTGSIPFGHSLSQDAPDAVLPRLMRNVLNMN